MTDPVCKELARKIFDNLYVIIQRSQKSHSNIVDGHQLLDSWGGTRPSDLVKEIKELEEFVFRLLNF